MNKKMFGSDDENEESESLYSDISGKEKKMRIKKHRRTFYILGIPIRSYEEVEENVPQ